MTVDLDGLTRGQMYYCKAAATNTNSASCGGPVVGGVKVFFGFMASSPSKTPPTNSKSMTTYNLTLDIYVWYKIEEKNLPYYSTTFRTSIVCLEMTSIYLLQLGEHRMLGFVQAPDGIH